MKRNIVLISVEKRKNTALKVQEVLTKYGCSIKIRLGLHDFSAATCSEEALIFLELASGKNENNLKLVKELEKLENIKIKSLEI